MKKTSCWLGMLGLVALTFSSIAAACDTDPAQCNTHPQVATAQSTCNGDPIACSSHNPAPQVAATGLGQAWPNTADVSRNPKFHAYAFTLGGVKFVQINDLNGNVLGAVGAAGDQFITLPVGRFAQLVTTPQQAPAIATSASSGKSIPVYQDGATTVLATPLSDGTVQLLAANGTCQDPIECSSRFNQPQALSAAACTTDPVQCNTHIPQVVAAACSGDPAQCSSHNPAPQVVAAACSGDPAQCSSHNPQAVATLTAFSPVPMDGTCTGPHPDPAACSTH